MKINTLTKSLLLVCLMLIGAVESFAVEYQGTGKLDVTKFEYPNAWKTSQWKPNETEDCIGNFNTSGYYVDINLNVTTIGWHKLVFKTTSGNNNVSYSLSKSNNVGDVKVDNKDVNTLSLSCANTGGWSNFNEKHIIVFYVNAVGQTTLRLTHSNNAANFTGLYLYSPLYQSVGDLNMYNFDFYTTKDARFTNDHTDSFNTEGDYMDLCLNLPFDGDYAIDFKASKYTNESNTTNYEVSIAEGNVVTFTPNTIAFNTNTGGWGNFTVNQTIELKNAKAGKTTVRITYHGSSNAYAANFKDFVLKCTTPASYSRSMSNQWGTICLPFALNLTGEESFAYYKLESASNATLNLVKMTGAIPAGTPAIVRRGNGETSITVTPASTDIATEPVVASGDLTMKGTFTATTISGADKWYISNNAFWPATKDGSAYNVTVAPYRAWLEGSVPSQARLNINIMDDATVDAIETVNTLISNNVEFYDINGRKLNEAKQGLNIIKGADGKARKVFIK